MKESTGKRIRKIMSDRNLKQVDILNMCQPYCDKYNIKLAKNDLSQYVNEKVQPKQDKLSILGLALNVSEAWLMGFDVPMDRKTPDPAASSSYDLLPDEASLVDNYRSLNVDGKKEVDKHMKYIVSQEEYIKDMSDTTMNVG